MLVKLSWHELNGMSWMAQPEIKIGTRVCKTNNRKTLGRIVDRGATQMNPHGEKYIKEVRVYWQTGRKAGKSETELVTNLINYDSYKKKITEELKELEENEALADKTGM